jgi:hypothetical protein
LIDVTKRKTKLLFVDAYTVTAGEQAAAVTHESNFDLPECLLTHFTISNDTTLALTYAILHPVGTLVTESVTLMNAEIASAPPIDIIWEGEVYVPRLFRLTIYQRFPIAGDKVVVLVACDLCQ